MHGVSAKIVQTQVVSYQVFFIDFYCNLKFILLISDVTAPGVVIKFLLTYT